MPKSSSSQEPSEDVTESSATEGSTGGGDAQVSSSSGSSLVVPEGAERPRTLSGRLLTDEVVTAIVLNEFFWF